MLAQGRDQYRSRSGRLLITFDFVAVGDAYHVYIMTPIDYGERDDDGHSTHRLTDDRGDYICWTHPLRTIAEAKSVAAEWTEATEKYIRYGKRFGS